MQGRVGRGGVGRDEVGRREGEGAHGIHQPVNTKTKRCNDHAIFCTCPLAIFYLLPYLFNEEAREEEASAEELAVEKMAKVRWPLIRTLTRGRQK